MRLRDELKVFGCKTDEQDFRDIVMELHAIMHPNWTDEELLFHPRDAIRYAEAIRCRSECAGLPDHMILRTLVNCRKQGKKGPGKAA